MIGETAPTTDVAGSAPMSACEGERDKLVVNLPGGWRIAESPAQWLVQSPMKSGWKNVASHITGDSMIRQLPERLWGPRSGRTLHDDVFAMLLALPAAHPGESKLAEVAEPAEEAAPSKRVKTTRLSKRADKARRSAPQ